MDLSHMMDDRLHALKRRYPPRIPVRVAILPAAWMRHRKALDEIVRRHPAIFGAPDGTRDYDEVSQPMYVEGEHVDAWGCVWSNIKHGMSSIVTCHPVPTRAGVHTLQIPDEDDGMPHGFMFLRLADLRGFDEIMVDFAEEPPELQMLIDKVLAHNLRQVQLRVDRAERKGEIIVFGDDLGMQHSLPISPAKWRKYLKPCYERIYRPVKDAGHYVYMHTDGHILEIIPDLIDCGVDVLNPQVGANGLENLARVCRGRVCVDLDLDRQQFPYWGPAEIDAHVREAVQALGAPEGGLWLKAEIADDVPIANVEAICCALEKYSAYPPAAPSPKP